MRKEEEIEEEWVDASSNALTGTETMTTTTTTAMSPSPSFEEQAAHLTGWARLSQQLLAAERRNLRSTSSSEKAKADGKHFRHCGALDDEDESETDHGEAGETESKGAPAGASPEAEERERQECAKAMSENETAAAAAAMGGAAVWFGPAVVGPMAVGGGPVLGLGAAGVLAYSATCRPEGDRFGDFSRELGRKGIEAASVAKSELNRIDQEHEISEKARQAARKAVEDVKSLGQRSADEVRGLIRNLWSRGQPGSRAGAEQDSELLAQEAQQEAAAPVSAASAA